MTLAPARLALGIALAALLALLAAAPAASANGVPQLVKLTYLPGVSNFGPQDAEGVLEFSFAEAYARVDVKHLPPVAGYTYEGWLTGGGAAPFRVGTITTREDGIGLLETRLTGLDSYDYHLFVIAARPDGAPENVLPETISIAGRFEVINDDGSSPRGDVRPGTLPDTGERPGLSQGQRIARTAFTVLAVGGIAFAALRLIRNRNRSIAP